MQPFIYALADPAESKHVRYVGMAIANLLRPYSHAKLARRGKRINPHLMNWIRKIQSEGREPIVLILEELAEGTKKKFLGFVERCYIKSLREIGHDLTNVHEGGDGGCTGPVSVATRVKMSDANLGNKSRLGQKRSLEEREKQRVSMLRYSVEHPEKAEAQRQFQTGRIASEETNEKRSIALLGNKNGLGRKDSIEVRNKRGNSLRGNTNGSGTVHTADTLKRRSENLRAYNADPANQDAIAERHRKQSITMKALAARKREAKIVSS